MKVQIQECEQFLDRVRRRVTKLYDQQPVEVAEVEKGQLSLERPTLSQTDFPPPGSNAQVASLQQYGQSVAVGARRSGEGVATSEVPPRQRMFVRQEALVHRDLSHVAELCRLMSEGANHLIELSSHFPRTWCTEQTSLSKGDCPPMPSRRSVQPRPQSTLVRQGERGRID